MTWGSVRFTLDELLIALRHRLIVITYFAIWAVVFPFRFRPDVPYLDIWRELFVFLLSQMTVILVFASAVAFTAALQRGRPNPAAHVTPVVFLGAMTGSTVATLTLWGFTGILSFDLGTMLIYAFVQIILAELVGSLVVTFLLPTILADIRAVAMPSVQPPDRAPDMQPDIPAEPTPVPPSGERPVAHIVHHVVLAGNKLPKHQIRNVRAAGNYLDITTDTDKLFVQATMRSFLQQMEPMDGLLLHRSLWIAAKEITFFQRQGADILVRTCDGDTVKTARSRQSEVLVWLKQANTPRRASAEVQSAGQETPS